MQLFVVFFGLIATLTVSVYALPNELTNHGAYQLTEPEKRIDELNDQGAYRLTEPEKRMSFAIGTLMSAS